MNPQSPIRFTIHPHACGEHDLDRHFVPADFRFIPTPVGSTRRHSENALKLHYDSSPRLWGAHKAAIAAFKCPRFIPTPVGSTGCHACHATRYAIRPHACGEHAQLDRAAITGVRFIPTPVGSTSTAIQAKSGPPIHPHACGEHAWPSAAITGVRFIPTPVGSTSTAIQACGEVRVSDSSPRLWGARLHVLRQQFRHRFIPTPVGSTSCMSGTASIHPHACGEH